MGRTLGDFRLRKKRHPTLLCTWPAILCDTIGTFLGSNKLQPPPKKKKIKPMINQDFPNLPHPPHHHHHQTWKHGPVWANGIPFQVHQCRFCHLNSEYQQCHGPCHGMGIPRQSWKHGPLGLKMAQVMPRNEDLWRLCIVHWYEFL